MCNILYISSSPRGAASYSKQVAENVIRDLREHDPHATLTVRDLAQLPLPHIDDDFVSQPAAQRARRRRNSTSSLRSRTP